MNQVKTYIGMPVREEFSLTGTLNPEMIERLIDNHEQINTLTEAFYEVKANAELVQKRTLDIDTSIVHSMRNIVKAYRMSDEAREAILTCLGEFIDKIVDDMEYQNEAVIQLQDEIATMEQALEEMKEFN